jgi:2-polyprenyl-6-methoxyphenol hydroxylase-like FAD-dependent oxidoreductase
MQPMSNDPRIAIVGGGPGGLALACILHVNGMASTVFERDAHAQDRPQGGTLDLHEESGLLALDRAGLSEAFLDVARYEDQGDRVLDRSGIVHFEYEETGAGNRPEVDRTALRDLFLNALPSGCVRWDSAVRDLSPAGEGQWNIIVGDRAEGPFDLVVGADGAWSQVRSFLSPYKPQYSGLTFIEFGIDDIDRRFPALAKLVGRGKVGIIGEGREIIAQRNGNAHVRGYAIFRVPADWAGRRFDFTSPTSVRAELLREFGDFAEEITDLFRAASDHFAARQIHALPVGHSWRHRSGLTLIGDAAHVMSPFGGEGVNAALLDAVCLARRLMEESDVSAAVTAFEEDMFARVEDVARESADAAATFLSHDSLAETLAIYRERLASMQAGFADAPG